MDGLFTVWDIDEDDANCIRLYINTNIPYKSEDSKDASALASIIENIDESALAVYRSEQHNEHCSGCE